MCSSHSTTHSHDFTSFRHRCEMPMIWVSAIITGLAPLIAFGTSLADSAGMLSSLDEETATEIRDFSSSALLLLLAPIFFYVYRFYMAAKARADAILVGPQQFPELYAMYEDLARRLDMPNPPKLYVTNGNGVVSAYAL